MPQRSRSTFGPNELQQFLSCFQRQCIRVGIQYVAPSSMLLLLKKNSRIVKMMDTISCFSSMLIMINF
uniref:Uncharacterized protein n=1 Tax=Panagrolaimus sp. PS1159 TaxID=55785 RepID=A0AC35F0P4_9BILA